MVSAPRGVNLVASAQRVLAHEMRLNERIGRVREVAVGRATNETGIALRVEPAGEGTLRGGRGTEIAMMIPRFTRFPGFTVFPRLTPLARTTSTAFLAEASASAP